ncbi:hypothetical protein HYC85_023023 [Camellia sinensis]|uniref:UDP-glycosyltransferases domain-containing protein n=1 Tax=Camellia sinensis TaxID=4442 RepID=A0A7J7GH67_CAMSI|nr:hypothetical protein HYC85_023023 [Camellia sinensis]
MQHAVWKAQPNDMKPGEVRLLSGLPEEMVLKYSDLKQRRHWMGLPPHGAGSDGGGSKRPRGPPFPGEPAGWVAEVERSIAILINTCDDLERSFLDYVANLTWKIDSKPRGSVFYVSFGSEVGPSMEEYPELANALEESKWPFIWVIQKSSGRPGPPFVGQLGPGSLTSDEGYFPHGLDNRVGKRGLIIHGWAPQLLILSHQSTGGFLSHCGWNSTVEAIGRGVPLLAWPIRGDQYYTAKLVVDHVKVGIVVSEGYPADMVKKDDIVNGIERVMTDEEIRVQAARLGAKFEDGFPASSLASLDAFRDFINQQNIKN